MPRKSGQRNGVIDVMPEPGYIIQVQLVRCLVLVVPLVLSLRIVSVRTHSADANPIANLLERLRSDNVEYQVQASEELGKLGPKAAEAIPGLLEALKSRNEQVSSFATQALAFIGEPAVPLLLEEIRSSEQRVRASAARALGMLAYRNDLSGVPGALTTALDDPSGDVRWRAAEALHNYPGEGERAGSALLKALEDTDDRVREHAGWALGSMRVERAIPRLIAMLDESNVSVRKAAAAGLAMGPCTKEAVPKLVEALADSEFDIRRLAGPQSRCRSARNNESHRSSSTDCRSDSEYRLP